VTEQGARDFALSTFAPSNFQSVNLRLGVVIVGSRSEQKSSAYRHILELTEALAEVPNRACPDYT